MRKRSVLAGLCAVLVPAFGCQSGDSELAVVGDTAVAVTAFQEHLEAVTGELWQGVTDPVASRLLDQFLDQEVVLVAADRDGPSTVPVEPAARSARVRALLEELCGPPPEPDEKEVELEVAKARSAERPARAHVRQMLLDTREAADETRRQLDDGADFTELSRRVSRAPNAEDGGDLGLLTQGGLPENLDEVIFALQAGEISEPVPGPSGYHIFQVLEVLPAGPPPREEVEPGVRRRLGEIAAREHASACVGRLGRAVGVRVNHERLWFRYDGRYAEVIHAS